MEPEGWLTQRNIEPAKTGALEGSGLKILRGDSRTLTPRSRIAIPAGLTLPAPIVGWPE
jgi:hypothetical protein